MYHMEHVLIGFRVPVAVRTAFRRAALDASQTLGEFILTRFDDVLRTAEPSNSGCPRCRRPEPRGGKPRPTGRRSVSGARKPTPAAVDLEAAAEPQSEAETVAAAPAPQPDAIHRVEATVRGGGEMTLSVVPVQM